MVRVSIIIKAFNEEARIAASIESAATAAENFINEIIVADCQSTDNTIGIASRYPVVVAQLADPSERCCGVAPQLGFQHSSGTYVYLLDGDMEMEPDFLTAAVSFLEDHPDIAGVGGLLEDMVVSNMEFQRRANQRTHLQPGIVDRLNGGGLYRRSAIEAVGYLSDRNLHGYEEFDLAARLRVAGWRLARLDCASVRHYGHDDASYALLLKRFRSKYAWGSGELLRAAVGRKHFRVVSGVREIWLWAVVLIWLALLFVLAMVGPLATFVITFSTPFALMALRKRSLTIGIYSVCSWAVSAIGFLCGLCRSRVNPMGRIRSGIINSKAPSPPEQGL